MAVGRDAGGAMPRSIDNSVPVVLLKDRGGHGALAVARTLGRVGVPTYLVTEPGPRAAALSRYWKKAFTWDLSGSPADALRTLLDAGEEIGGRPILLSIADAAAIFVEENADALRARFLFPEPASAAIRTLTNKWNMFLAAKEHGIPTPEVSFPDSRDDVVRFIAKARFPVVMKGADQLKAQAKWKKIVRSAEELLEKYDSVTASGPANLILQEYIPGSDETVWMCTV